MCEHCRSGKMWKEDKEEDKEEEEDKKVKVEKAFEEARQKQVVGLIRTQFLKRFEI